MRALVIMLAAAAGAYTAWRALSAPKETPAVSTPPPAPKTSPKATQAPSVVKPGVATSNPETVFFKHQGAGTLSGGVSFYFAQLWDPERDTWARLTYRDGARALARLGLRYPTFAELDEIKARPDALILQPCTLVGSAADAAKMGTEEFWRKHDACVQKQLDVAGWHGERPLVSNGKHWAYGAPAGRSWLHGWYDPKNGGKPIQNQGKTFHDDGHIDYSSTIVAVKDGSIA